MRTLEFEEGIIDRYLPRYIKAVEPSMATIAQIEANILLGCPETINNVIVVARIQQKIEKYKKLQGGNV